MTIDEWLTAYLLQFGSHQLHVGSYVKGEFDFWKRCMEDLNGRSISDTADRMREIHRQRLKQPQLNL